MFYNSLFQSVFDFWIKLSKKIVAKLQKKVNDFAVKSGSKNNKRVRDTSLWKFTGYACGIKVNFSPCVMTGAVLAIKENSFYYSTGGKVRIIYMVCV